VIATVLAMRPEILVLDEPMANLDPRTRDGLIDFLNELKRPKASRSSQPHTMLILPR